jgi:GNAT superfamily N-acetyltransferase
MVLIELGRGMNIIDTAWRATIAGYVGVPFVQQVATPLACAPIQGVRVAYQIDSPAPCDDFYVANCDPSVAVVAIKSVPPIANQYITVLDDRPDCVAHYTALGLLHAYSEVLMACDVRQRIHTTPDYDVRRATRAEVHSWNALDPEGAIWLHPLNVFVPAMAHYAVFVDEQLVARGRSLQLASGCSYVSMVYTAPAYRRQGLALALMQHMLNEDACAGMQWSTLLATQSAVPLYQRVGYQALATTHVFTP